MQGRLSPMNNNQIQSFPYEHWENEFKIASDNNFHLIEWIIDQYDNPIFNETQIPQIKKLMSKYNIKINSLCCDFFMNNLLFRISKNKQRKNILFFKTLIKNSHDLGIKILEIPLVDSSSIKNEDEENELIANLKEIIKDAKDFGILIGLETDYPPQKILKLLKKIDNDNIVLNYDTGNSASLGFNPKEELTLLGKYIKNIHIKDRKLNGPTVPFGEGNTNFNLFFSTLRNIDYKGDFIIQGARIENESPDITCIKYRDFVMKYIERYF